MEHALSMLGMAAAIMVVAALAHDFGRRWLQEQKEQRIANETLTELMQRQALMEDVQKKLAQDWLKKFNQLENDWKKLEERARSQFAGAIEQTQAQYTRGFNRG